MVIKMSYWCEVCLCEKRKEEFYLGYETLCNSNWVGVTLLQVMKQITKTHIHTQNDYIALLTSIKGLSRYETIQLVLQLCAVL